MEQVQAVPPSTNNNANEESDIRKWFATTWFEYGGALLRKDFEKLDALAEEIETKFRANCYENGKWIVIGAPASYTDQYELPFCCFMAISMGLLRQRIPSSDEPAGQELTHKNPFDWFEKMEDMLLISRYAPGDFSAVSRELGVVMKAELVKAVESRDEGFVTELYFHLLRSMEWDDPIYSEDWFKGSGVREKYDQINSLELHVVRTTGQEQPDEERLSALGQFIRERVLAAVRSGDKEMVQALLLYIVTEDYSGWRDAGCYDPAYQRWLARQEENDSSAA